MAPSYQIAVADEDLKTLKEWASWLTAEGHTVVKQVHSAVDLPRHCSEVDLDLLIAAFQNGSVGRCTEIAAIAKQRDVPLVAVSDSFDNLTWDRLQCGRPFAHLIKSVRRSDLLAATRLAFELFQEFRNLREKVAEMTQTLENRKLVERAKGILMRHHSLDESSAYNHLRRLARNKRFKMAEMAKSVILAEATLVSPQNIQIK